MKRQTLATIFIVATAALAVLLSPSAEAAVALTLRLVRGGLDLDFGTIQTGQPVVTQELELTLTNSGSAQYRLYQELPNFLVNERGSRLPDDALIMQLSRGTTGSLATGAIVPVTTQAQELFVSNRSGSSDTLLLAYSIRSDNALPSGSYRGILRFRVELLDTGAITTQTLTVRLVVSGESSLERSAASPSRLDFGSVSPGSRSSELIQELTLRNNTATAVQFLQDVPEVLVNGEGERLPLTGIVYALTATEGVKGWQALSESTQPLLMENDVFARPVRLAYAVEVPLNQRAGLYRGMIRLRLAAAGTGFSPELRLPVSVEVPEVFTVSVKPADGASRLDFGRTPASDGPVERSMTIQINSNLGRSYQVLAGLNHALVLPTGETLPPKALVWSVRQAQQGRAVVASDSSVPVGSTPIYQSDASGSPETLTLLYRLSIPEDAKDGVYSGQVDVSVIFL